MHQRYRYIGDVKYNGCDGLNVMVTVVQRKRNASVPIALCFLVRVLRHKSCSFRTVSPESTSLTLVWVEWRWIWADVRPKVYQTEPIKRILIGTRC